MPLIKWAWIIGYQGQHELLKIPSAWRIFYQSTISSSCSLFSSPEPCQLVKALHRFYTLGNTSKGDTTKYITDTLKDYERCARIMPEYQDSPYLVKTLCSLSNYAPHGNINDGSIYTLKVTLDNACLSTMCFLLHPNLVKSFIARISWAIVIISFFNSNPNMVLTKGNDAVMLKLRICQRHIRFEKASGSASEVLDGRSVFMQWTSSLEKVSPSPVTITSSSSGSLFLPLRCCLHHFHLRCPIRLPHQFHLPLRPQTLQTNKIHYRYRLLSTPTLFWLVLTVI